MASVAHVAVGMVVGRLAWRPGVKPVLLMTAYTLASMLPDVDVVAFTLGIPYEAPFGHRGASHSLLVAAVLGLLVLAVARAAGGDGRRAALYTAGVVASHGLLDTLTDGGLGVALLWPFSDARYFAPWRPIPVAPIGFDFLSPRGWHVAITECAYSAPLLLWSLWPRARQAARGRSSGT